VPVTVIGYVPGVAVPETLKVRLEEPPVETDAGTKPALTPAGKPDADRAIDSGEPDTTAVLTAVPPLPPWATETVADPGAIEKSLGGGAAVTVRVRGVEWIAEGDVPVTVNG
jgi:hypothetical protein